MDLQTIVSKNPRIASGEITQGKEEVLLHLDTTAYHSLNEVGTMIWRTLETPMSLGELIDRIAQAYEDAPSTLAREIGDFVAALADRDLVVLEQPG